MKPGLRYWDVLVELARIETELTVGNQLLEEDWLFLDAVREQYSWHPWIMEDIEWLDIADTALAELDLVTDEF